ncbi:MAG TPA: hypothetical protein VJN22_06775, partial [Candidatus Eremiobacteraceae bacterium]|nr:hypothetical protein [Candidatus Eremiobacteraceae bacterium]
MIVRRALRHLAPGAGKTCAAILSFVIAVPLAAAAAATPAPSPSPTASPSPSPTASPMATPTAPPPVFATAAPDQSDFPNTDIGGAPPPQPGATFGAQPGASPNAGSGVQPGDVRVTADRIAGNAKGDMTAQGHVHLTTDSVDVSGDQAVYTAADKTVRMTGNVHFVGADGDTATARSLAFRTDKNSFSMYDVAGQTSAVAFQGQSINGYVYYRGKEVDVGADGRSIIRNGWVTTCSLDHVAYHVTGKEIEI